MIEKGRRLIAVYNRKNPIDLLQIFKGKTFIMEAIFQSIRKGYVKEDGEQAGFEKSITILRYKSFDEHRSSGHSKNLLEGFRSASAC